MKSFSASWDGLTKIVSGVLVAIVLAVAVLTESPLITGLIVAVFALTFLWAPLGYEVDSGVLRVRRLIGPARIPLDRLREARMATSDDLRGCVRLFGSGGLFGYFGLFRTTKLGKATWYCTSRKNMVVLATDSKTIVLSPDDASGFLNEVGHRPGTPHDVLSGPRIVSKVAILFGSLFAVGVLGVVAWVVSYSPGPARYTLTRDSLIIHDRFYPVTVQASQVDVPAARIVDISQDPQWQPTSRTNGFANGHYASGWFRVASGEKVRMYRAGGRQLVLLPAKAGGTPILLQAADPDAFLVELRRTW
jgi:hypothetical protein